MSLTPSFLLLDINFPCAYIALIEGAFGRRHYVELKQRVEEEIDRLNPRLRELAEGDVEVISVDEKTGTVTLRMFGGRLH